MPKQPQPVQITKRYTAMRHRRGMSAFTTIQYKEPGLEFGRDRIHVASRLSFGSKGWEPAKVNWSALGSVTPAEAAEFAKALAWASREAARIDKANLKHDPLRKRGV
jgi:hypothetical protein